MIGGDNTMLIQNFGCFPTACSRTVRTSAPATWKSPHGTSRRRWRHALDSVVFWVMGDGPVDYLEVWSPAGRDLVALAGDKVLLGAAPSSDVVLDDPAVSELHAVLERLGSAWTVRDVGSRNGTFVNGERLGSERRVLPGDELRLGRTRLLLRGPRRATSSTETLADPPRLTGRERDVLVELCRPLAAGGAFNEPATVREIAARMVVSDAAVKQHLARLYDKFDVGEGDRRRARLANAAVTTGAIALVELRLPPA